ncbi:MAG TPA: hypothetical protein DEG17_21830 [Cyanobacteria bacterium UBA11149]|nr:hypothetical protein [Cyanobacteria bacterium UBA11367]HBE59387.1 hypothetical protein [Cyanobacteria bacterium UBA11366]HBK64865.1 hypothetical protein [Cyanobacteria bacterium UBA11166]HBR72306.1 hypothetical protein [Cyanobacteria bacterium UBA11159]HBS70351.1 hypothetical protein [Cyanobacteria bacterium UBA11153]HBW91425.1 hypothetical protein [Cyanobacteria bacterium UBA11149]HCA96282.1 hypothetical protein [Cyanobacteria bacterium UBA9226]
MSQKNPRVPTLSQEGHPTLAQVEENKIEQEQPPNTENQVKELKHAVLATGLEDYGFWCEQMQKEHAARGNTNKPFRRGRIYS